VAFALFPCPFSRGDRGFSDQTALCTVEQATQRRGRNYAIAGSSSLEGTAAAVRDACAL
jgi:hypothetical protein